jgi:hypothetical protein
MGRHDKKKPMAHQALTTQWTTADTLPSNYLQVWEQTGFKIKVQGSTQYSPNKQFRTLGPSGPRKKASRVPSSRLPILLQPALAIIPSCPAMNHRLRVPQLCCQCEDFDARGKGVMRVTWFDHNHTDLNCSLAITGLQPAELPRGSGDGL